MLKSFLTAGAALALCTTSTMAAAAPASTSAPASLSVAKSVRSASVAGKADQLNGGSSFFVIAIGVALIALGVVAIVDNGDDNPDSP